MNFCYFLDLFFWKKRFQTLFLIVVQPFSFLYGWIFDGVFWPSEKQKNGKVATVYDNSVQGVFSHDQFELLKTAPI